MKLMMTGLNFCDRIESTTKKGVNMTINKKYEDNTTKELHDLRQKISAEIDALRDKGIAIREELQRRYEEE